MHKAVLYYTCNTHRLDIEMACRAQLAGAVGDYPIVSISRGEPIDFGDVRLVVDLPRAPRTMFVQIVAGLEATDADYAFLCESDVLYHPLHFAIEPQRDDVFYYNANVWRTRYPDGHCVWTDDLQQVSGICANREALLDFYSKKIESIDRGEFDRHYEPQEKTGCVSENWLSEYPNLDIRHGRTLTRSKWSPHEFRNKRYTRGWKEAGFIEGWGKVEGGLLRLLEDITDGTYVEAGHS